MESIIKWFASGCDYHSGVAIYAALPDCKPILLRNFKGKETIALKEKLKYELQKHLPASSAPPAPPVPKTKVLIVGHGQPSAGILMAKTIAKLDQPKLPVFFHDLPPELRDDLLEANELHRKNCMLKVALNEVPAQKTDEALDLQLQIFSNIRKNAICWERIDYYLEHKKVLKPGKSKLEKLRAPQMLRRQQQLQSSSSKLAKRVQSTAAALELATSVKDRTRLQKQLDKQTANLHKQRTDIITLTTLIDGI